MTTNDAKSKLLHMIESASSERLKTIELLLSMPDTRAAKYGEALSLLIDADYDVTALKVALRHIQKEAGPDIIKLRTPTRIFKFLKDEDDPDAGYYYRAFYVKTITVEQRSAISTAAAKRLRLFTSRGIDTTNTSPEYVSKKMTELFDSDEFAEFLTQPDSMYRQIVSENIVEVEVDAQGVLEKPIQKASSEFALAPDDIPQYILNKLEEDLRLLIDEQDLLGKNLQMADIFAY